MYNYTTIQADRGFATMYFLCQVVDEEFHVGFHRRLSVTMRNALNADYGCRVHSTSSASQERRT